MSKLEHVALKAQDLDRTAAFYGRLGGRTARQAAGERLSVEFDGGSRLLFDRADAVNASAVTYLGVELPDFAAVDRALLEFAYSPDLDRDVRETYRHSTGPYGFFVRDPNGYVVKVFKYNEVAR